MAGENSTGGGFDLQSIMNLVAPMLGGAAQGAASGQMSQMNARQQALQNLMNARTAEAQMQEGFLNRDRSAAQSVAQLDPLGQQQQYAQRQQMLKALMGGLAGGVGERTPGNPLIAQAMGTGGGISGIVQGMAKNGLNSGAFSDEATARALADYRSNLMQINPYMNMGTLGEYGLDPSYDRDWRASGEATIGRRQPIEEAMRSAMSQNTTSAQQELNSIQNQKSTPWWKKILGPAAGIGAAFIPGVGPLLAAGIGAGVGGATNGVQGAILGGGAGFGADKLQGMLGGGGHQLNNSMGQVFGSNGSAMQAMGSAPSVGLQLQNSMNPMNMMQGLAGAVNPNNPNIPKPMGSGSRPMQSPQYPGVTNPSPSLPASLNDPMKALSKATGIGANPRAGILGTIADYAEELPVIGNWIGSYADGPQGPDTPWGQVLNSPVGMMMSGAGATKAAQMAGSMAPQIGGAVSATGKIGPTMNAEAEIASILGQLKNATGAQAQRLIAQLQKVAGQVPGKITQVGAYGGPGPGAVRTFDTALAARAGNIPQAMANVPSGANRAALMRKAITGGK